VRLKLNNIYLGIFIGVMLSAMVVTFYMFPYEEIESEEKTTIELIPSDDINFSDWARAECGPHYYQCIYEDLENDDSNYIWLPPGSKEEYRDVLFILDDPIITLKQVTNITVKVRACSPDGAKEETEKMKLIINNYYSPAIEPTGSWTNYSYTWENNPSTDESWQAEDLVNLRAGLSGNNYNLREIKLTYLVVIVKGVI